MSSSSLVSEKERLLNEALAEYLEAEEAGRPPDPAAFLADHPGLTEELNEFLTNRADLVSLAQPFRTPLVPSGAGSPPTVLFEEPVAPAAVPAAGGLFGDYELLEEIARGGMGVVYRARQLSLNRVVALKMILAGQSASRAALRRFRVEAEATAHLDHPNIVPIYDVGEINGQPYFTMKLVEAGCLATRLGDFRLPQPTEKPSPASVAQRQARLAGLVATVARAVHHAHQRGILHRDLKPANILLDAEANPLLTDFGLAKRFEENSGLTQSHSIVGTAAYMAPEQAKPGKEPLSTVADVYALGAILYELLTGRPPHLGETCFDILIKVVQDPALPPRQRNPLVAEDLNAICMKCLAKEPAHRYGSALELAEDLERWRAGEAISLRPHTLGERARRWARRNRLAATLLAAVAVLIAVVMVGSPIAVWNIAAARKEAEDNADRAEKKAEEAELLAEKERTARTLAEQAQAQNHRLLVSGYVANGTHALDAGDPFGALVWYGEVLHLDAGSGAVISNQSSVISKEARSSPITAHCSLITAEEEAHRVRLAAVLRRCPRLGQVWFAENLGPVVFSPTGRSVLLVQKGSGRLWDVARGVAVSPPMQHREPIQRALFSPDGGRLLTISGDGVLQVWDANTGKAEGSKIEHGGKPIKQAVFSPDGAQVVVIGPERTLSVWNAKSGTRSAGPVKAALPLLFASFSPDGKHLVACGGDPLGPRGERGEIILWELPLGKSPPKIISTDKVVHWALLPDPMHVVGMSGAKQWLQRWDLSPASPAPLLGQEMQGFRYDTRLLSPDGSRALKVEDPAVQVYDLISGKPSGPPLLHGGDAILAAFSPDGKRVLTAARDRTVRVWDAASGQPAIPPLRHGRATAHAAFSTDGQRLMTWMDNVVRVWDLGSRELVQPLLHLGGKSAAISPDGRLVARIDSKGTTSVRDAASDKLVCGDLKLPRPVTHLAFAADGRRLLLVGDGSAQVWDVLADRAVTPVLKHGGGQVAPVKEALFTPDGSRAAILHARELEVFDAGTGNRQSTQQPQTGLRGLTLSPDGTALVQPRVPLILEVRDLGSGEVRGEPLKHVTVVTHATFSPDGAHLTSATAEGSAFLWDLATGRLAAPPLQHGQPLRQVVFSGDGRRLVTVAENRSLRVWDVATGQPLSPLLYHVETVDSASLSQDGRRLLARGKSGASNVWDLSPDPRPVADLHGLTEVLAGQRLNRESGDFEALEMTRLRDAWPKLRARYPQEFSLQKP